MLAVDWRFCLLWALLLLVLPLPWLAAAGIAAAFHELCHLATLYLLGGTPERIRVEALGVVMESHIPDPGKELLCAMAGPAGSFMLFALYRVFPRTALCAVVQGCFNLLPLYPLDGGRITTCTLQLLLPENAELLQKHIERFTIFLILVFAAFWAVRLCSPFPLFLSGLVLVKRKIPCKEDRIRVQ